MHVRKVAPSFATLFDTARHGVADIVQLEIDEHLLAGTGELAEPSGNPPA